MLSKDGRKLTYHMKFSIRFSFIFILISIAGMFLFAFTPKDFTSASMAGKINTIILPLLILTGSTYINSVAFNKNSNKILITKGFFPFIKKTSYPFNDLEAVIFNPIGDPNKENSFLNITFRKYMFGFKLSNGSYIILERAASEKMAAAFYAAFRAFFPNKISTIK